MLVKIPSQRSRANLTASIPQWYWGYFWSFPILSTLWSCLTNLCRHFCNARDTLVTRWAENHSLWQSSGMWQGGYKSGDVSWLKQVPWIPFTKTFFWVIWWSSKSYFRICKEARSDVITINYRTFTISKSFPKHGWFLVKFRSIPGHQSVKSFYYDHFYVNLWFSGKVYDQWKIKYIIMLSLRSS